MKTHFILPLLLSVVALEQRANAELYTPPAPVPALVRLSLSGVGGGHGTIWRSATGHAASANNPAIASEALSTYTTNLVAGGVLPPRVAVGGQLAEVLFYGDAPGYPGYNQVNFRMPAGVSPGSAVPMRLTYLSRSSNPASIGAQ